MIAQLNRLIRNLAVFIAVLVAVSACGSSPTVKHSDDSGSTYPSVTKNVASSSVAERAVSIAVAQVGVPYRYGGQGPNGFDCSGLVHYSYRHAGKAVPRTTGQLWENATTINRSELRAGDLLFFRFNGKMQHVGMYIGDDRFVHAPSTGKKVQVASLESDLYGQALLRAGRPR